jgi:uncharacterized membrane protein YphA (DoxX/SURF4 family)
MGLSWTHLQDEKGWPRNTFLLLLRLGLAAVFIGAAVPKIQAPDLFALNIHNYQMLPAWAVNVSAVILPWLELLIGVGLAVGVWSRACAATMAALMLVFMVALATAAVRGLSIACGCFDVGEEAGQSSLLWAALRDLAFLVAAWILVRTDGPSLRDLIRLRRSGILRQA